MRRVSERLQDILDAINAIERYTQSGKSTFDTEELIQVWIIHHCHIIGEASRNLPEALRAQYVEIPWPQIISLRNRIAHEYFRTDLKIVWDITQADLPQLRAVVVRMLAELPPEDK